MTTAPTFTTLPTLPSLVVGTVSHRRRTPMEHAFTHRHYQWLVDVDDLPRRRWPLSLLTRICARDHLDDGRLGGGIRGTSSASSPAAARPSRRTTGSSCSPTPGSSGMSSTRSPSTGASRPTGLRATVLEVHNTYGERHAYLLELDDRGRTRTDKQFYVSPFNDTRGTYDVRMHLDADRVAVTVALDRDGERVLTATTTGAIRQASRAAVVRTALRHLPMTWRVTALIRLHGVWLWARRLPIQPRSPHHQEDLR